MIYTDKDKSRLATTLLHNPNTTLDTIKKIASQYDDEHIRNKAKVAHALRSHGWTATEYPYGADWHHKDHYGHKITVSSASTYHLNQGKVFAAFAGLDHGFGDDPARLISHLKRFHDG